MVGLVMLEPFFHLATGLVFFLIFQRHSISQLINAFANDLTD